ncbi:MAG: hypothetical protein IJH37_01995 [Clostridia bacterium]|nr:hypothetical protein [Clostridia bacterium]
MAKLTLFAAIDIGSSQMSMKIFQLSKTRGISVIDTCQSNIAIGRETYNVGKISYELTSEICRCLESFKRVMREYGVTAYICYATSAVREAKNSEYIRDQILIRTGLKVGIVSNEEEIFLHHKAMALNMKNFDGIIEDGATIVDVSAGSIQISSYERSELKFSQNFPLGSMRVVELMSGVNNNTIEFSSLVREHTLNMLSHYSRSFFMNPKHKSVILTGSQSDSIKSALALEGDIVDSKRIEGLYNEIKEIGFSDFGDKYGFSYDEARRIMASLLLYIPFLRNKRVYMPDVEFTDGICVEYAEKNKFTHTKHIFTNDIITSAMYYAARFNINEEHVNKTIDYCSEIFGALAKKFGLSGSDLVLLKVAAIYADTGMYINVNDSNLYSYNIKRSHKLLGLSNRDNDIISFVVLFSDGLQSDNEEYKYLTKSRKLQISKLAAILSLAKSLDSEYKQKIHSIRVSLKNGGLNITAATDEDITMEQWQFSERGKFFEEVFGIKAKLMRS